MILPAINADALAALKFADCVPGNLAIWLLERRTVDAGSLQQLLGEPVRFVVDTAWDGRLIGEVAPHPSGGQYIRSGRRPIPEQIPEHDVQGDHHPTL